MRKINFEDYNVKVQAPQKSELCPKCGHNQALKEDGTLRFPMELPYEVKDSIVGLLFHPELKLGGMELLKQNELAGKILNSEDPDVLLEEAEYEQIKRAINVVKGFGRNEVELVRRILEAPKVEVEAKKALKKVE